MHNIGWISWAGVGDGDNEPENDERMSAFEKWLEVCVDRQPEGKRVHRSQLGDYCRYEDIKHIRDSPHSFA